MTVIWSFYCLSRGMLQFNSTASDSYSAWLARNIRTSHWLLPVKCKASWLAVATLYHNDSTSRLPVGFCCQWSLQLYPLGSSSPLPPGLPAKTCQRKFSKKSHTFQARGPMCSCAPWIFLFYLRYIFHWDSVRLKLIFGTCIVKQFQESIPRISRSCAGCSPSVKHCMAKAYLPMLALGSGPRYLICVTHFAHSVTKSDTSGHFLSGMFFQLTKTFSRV